MATPPLNAVGEYVVKAPFSIDGGAIYKCEALNGFEALEAQGVNVFDNYYAPYGLTQADYEADRDSSVDIVTLMSDTANTLILPSSYIDSFPDQGIVDYKHAFIAVDIGMLPANYLLTPLLTEIEDISKAYVGTDTEAKLVLHPVAETIDATRHEQLTVARNALKEIRPSYALKYLQEVEKSARLSDKIRNLEQMVIDLQK
jgi:hypothetical protein